MAPGSSDLGDLHKVWDVKPLKKPPGQDEARKILEKIAKQVQPIMRKHKWRVKLLSEFCPSNPSLLGLNVGGGVEVKLRLRRHNKEWDFFPYESVLDTMLHELCHCDHGPHDAKFYKLWDEIRKECEELMAKGISGTGDGFDGHGRRLGGYTHTPPLSSMRRAALSAAEKRARTNSLLPSGPRRLGGNNDIMSALSPIQAAAMAAERRLYDDLWCGSAAAAAAAVAGASSDSDSEYNDYNAARAGPSSMKRPADSSGASVPEVDALKESKQHRSDNQQPRTNIGLPVLISISDDDKKETFWECRACTLQNKPLSLVCEVCGSKRVSEGQTACSSWTCKFCTLENNSKLDNCATCSQWRYSYGAPVSSHSPYVGT